ncbi:hypothetical protein BsWGS_14747 [Bradybaena similaris]
MDVVTIAIGVVVFIFSALMIYCISAFSMREKTFEEVMAEQRRQEEIEREKAKAEKRAEKELHKKKHKKGKNEKVKEKAAQVTEPELKVEPKMVNLEIEPEIIEPTETLGLNAGVRQRGVKKEKATKPILQNKGEHTPVVEKAAELYHKPVVPKDELELKKSHEKVTHEKVSHEKVAHEKAAHEKAAHEKVTHEKVTHEKVTHEKVAHEKVAVEKIEKVKVVHAEIHEKENKVKHSTESSKENLPPKKAEKDEEPVTRQHVTELDKRPAKQKAHTDDVPLNGSRLISTVKSANLTDNEVQSLIDILLNKQGLTPASTAATESWNKKSQKGDPVAALKKQLEEKERALQEEQAITAAANTRAKDLRNELATEKTKYVNIEKKLKESVDQHHSELLALQQRMQHAHEQHLTETSNLQSRIKALEQGSDKAALQKLTDEKKAIQDNFNLTVNDNVRLNEKLKATENELNKTISTVQASEAAKKALESRISVYEQKIKKLESAQKDVDSMTHKQIEEVNHELRRAESKNTSLSSDLQKANGALSVAQEEVKTLKAKLQELEVHLTKTDTSKDAEARLQESEQKRSDLEGNVKNLEKQLAGLSQRLAESSTDITRLQQENKALLDENKTIREQLQAAPASNGDIHENGPNIPLAEHEQIVSGKAKEVSELAAGLEAQKKALVNVQGQLDTKLAEVTDLQEQLNLQKKKNNELREKNWKAMEALEKSEKSATEKVDKALKSARELSTAGVTEIETYDKAVFQRLFPNVQVSDKLPHKEWIAVFEKQAIKNISDKADVSVKSSALAEENEKLRRDVDDLKNKLNVLTATESRLIEVEEQNKRVHSQLAEYEKQVVELKSQSERLKYIEEENVRLKHVENNQLISNSAASDSNTERYTQLELDNTRLKSELENFRTIVAETENKLHQLEKSIDDEEKKWQEKLKQAQSQSKTDSGSLQRIGELESLVSQQESQLQDYRSTLSHTEDRLRGVELKVESAERDWSKRLETSLSELAETKHALSILRQEIQTTQGSREMETRVAELEEELREAHDMIVIITKEKESVITKLSEKQTETSGVDTHSLDKELSEIRVQLENERKKNRDLSLNIVKLNGIIKTGQDALSQEQGLVKKLQESIDSKSVNSGATELEEVDQAASTSDSGTSV